MTPSDQAEAILAERHRTITRKPNKPSKYDKEARRTRVKIDAMLAKIRDKKNETDDIGG